jgi:uncharacterized protein (TIGR03437 family)
VTRAAAFCAIAIAAAAAPASGYYHFVHYLSGGNATEKFDLRSLPNKTITFFVSENGPQVFSQTDTFNSVLSQIRQATLVWNGVRTSDLRVSFGGLENGATLQNTAGGDVVFEDLPPGVYGFGGPTSKAAPTAAADGSQFLPITRSTVHLNRNLTVLPGPSYNETFFMTAVHEMGHALGLQHSFASSTMSQATTRATTLSHPIDNDDIAGISALYPNPNFAQFGSIAGRITAGGQGVHLASVVAIRVGFGAVSGVTNPDGTYRIDGVPPGQYFLYVHTMPPDADINGPWNADGSVAAPSGPVNSLFYPGVGNITQASPISVQPGITTPGVDIATAKRASVSLYDAAVYSYLNNNTIGPIKPAVINMFAQGPATVVASGAGLGSDGQAPGLGVQIIGGSLSVLPTGVRPFQSGGFTYIALDLNFNLGAQPGSQHVVFTTPDYMYVLPSGINATQKAPPTVTSVAANPDGSLTVTGTSWAPDTLLYFDGLPSAIKALDWQNGFAVVVPPPGASGQQATLTAYNTDGQNSQLLQAAAPLTYAYGNSPAPAITSISPSSLPAGAEAAVDITGTGFNFTPGLTTVGFGTSDIVVRSVFVLSPNHLQANVSISPNAALSNPDVSAISGFQLATAPAGFQITPAVAGLPAPVPILENGVSGLNGAYAGAIVSLYGTNLASAGPATVTIGGQAATVLFASATQVNLQVPPSLPPGPALLNLNNGIAPAFPVVVNIDTPPAGISAVQNSAGVNIDNTHPAHQGDLLIVSLTKFAAPGAIIDPSRVQVRVGGVLHNVLQVIEAAPLYQVGFLLNSNDPVGQSDALIVYLDGKSSVQAFIPVAHANGSFVAAPGDAGVN